MADIPRYIGNFRFSDIFLFTDYGHFAFCRLSMIYVGKIKIHRCQKRAEYYAELPVHDGYSALQTTYGQNERLYSIDPSVAVMIIGNVITEFQLSSPIESLKWHVRIDDARCVLSVTSENRRYKWAKRIEAGMPIDAFFVRKNAFILWQRPEMGYHRMMEISAVSAHDIFTGESLWNWQDHLISVIPYEEFLYMITYRTEFHKGYLFKVEAREGRVIWKATSDAPLISWDINRRRVIVRDSEGRVYILNSQTGDVIVPE